MEACHQEVIGVGLAHLSRVRAPVDVDLVEKRFWIRHRLRGGWRRRSELASHPSSYNSNMLSIRRIAPLVLIAACRNAPATAPAPARPPLPTVAVIPQPMQMTVRPGEFFTVTAAT